ncbi:calcium-binding protein [Neisseria canis]
MKAYGGDDQVTVQNYFNSSSYQYKQFVFDNSSVKVDENINISIV